MVSAPLVAPCRVYAKARFEKHLNGAMHARPWSPDRAKVPTRQEDTRTPPASRSLRTVRGARLELTRLYAQTKAGRIEPLLAGKLTHILSVLISSAHDHEIEERLVALEPAHEDQLATRIAALEKQTNGRNAPPP